MSTLPVYPLRPHPGPESEVTVTACCMDGGCAWESEPVPASAATGCEAHAAATGHRTFAVCLEYIALVTAEGGR
ncbi:hypothetical protein HHL19_20615 [Streptomyces sp. R302]|uniref:hypothetical protein n=1 Tax=unclassified Streptomyces TaxID=2593676 RepID=UPI00145DACD6|nr:MULTISPECIES: hypothetical protein [unclassified Streptomyces]NML50911.1 hypothetical protein [Streptomyces sp. R301]NML81005.1 hypothetical protein [Streptomyces sp. R302]